MNRKIQLINLLESEPFKSKLKEELKSCVIQEIITDDGDEIAHEVLDGDAAVYKTITLLKQTILNN